jgi:heme a synthase
MPKTRDHAVMLWIISFAFFAMILVIFGGFVRLTRSGLSIVEWNPIQGTVPPLSQNAWQSEFAKYQKTPEYQEINRGMTLAAFQEIFIIEWLHRLLARLAGLVFAIPFLIFLVNRRIPLREALLYVLMGALFLSQALMGWIMVSSGLVDRPSVSHFLLAAHLFLALSLIGLAEWTALGHAFGFGSAEERGRWSAPSLVALLATMGLLVQMAYGAFTAGLRAGLVSDTWPMMLGRWVPRELLGQLQPAAANLVAAPLTVAFIHRWLAVLVLALAGAAYYVIGKTKAQPQVRVGLRWIAALSVVQMALGVAVVVSHVSIAVALLHQANALALFVLAVFVLSGLRRHDAVAAQP